MSAAILGLATALPSRSIEQTEVADIAATFLFEDPRQGRALKALFRRSQVRRRSSVVLEPRDAAGLPQSFYPPAADNQDRGPRTSKRMERYALEVGPLALAAAERALAASPCTADQITHLVTVSCTGFAAPGVDVTLIKRLGLAPTVGRVHVGFMGCHGVLNGMRVARAFVEADPKARPLLCAVELCSLHFQYGWEADWLVANSLFADGAAAAVIGPPGGDRTDAWRIQALGSCLMPDSEDAMTWRIADHGFQMSLSAQVPELIARYLRPWLESWLKAEGVAIEQIGSWAVHPGGPRILGSVTNALGLPAQVTDVSAAVLAEHGNMSSPTVLFVIEQLQRLAAPRPCVALAFGPGLIAEAALFL